MKITALIMAAGISKRMGNIGNKIFMQLKEPMLYHVLLPFEEHNEISDIIIVTHKDDIDNCKALVTKYNLTKIKNIVEGGQTRQDSSYNGVMAAENTELILIHDAARPFVTKKIITHSIADAKVQGASVVAVPAKDTIKEAESGIVKTTLDRDTLWQTQTPQTFKAELIKEAHENARQKGIKVTDDAALVEHLGKKVKITTGSCNNIKITTQDDLNYAKSLLSEMVKTGIGQDSHRFTKNKPLVLAGVRIENHPGLEANSDGDVVIHALCNALCSAIGRGSLSEYADKMCANGITNSKEYLKVALGYVNESGYKPHNISIAIEAKTPKIEPLIPSMKESLSKILKIKKELMGITATSGEGLTEFGQGKGIQAIVSVTLK